MPATGGQGRRQSFEPLGVDRQKQASASARCRVGGWRIFGRHEVCALAARKLLQARTKGWLAIGSKCACGKIALRPTGPTGGWSSICHASSDIAKCRPKGPDNVRGRHRQSVSRKGTWGRNGRACGSLTISEGQRPCKKLETRREGRVSSSSSAFTGRFVRSEARQWRSAEPVVQAHQPHVDVPVEGVAVDKDAVIFSAHRPVR